MSTLVDAQIKQWAEAGGLEPCDLSLINPASVNIRIGPTLKIESPNGTTYDVDISECHKDNPFFVEPGEWILGHSLEIVTLEADQEAEVCLRSSAARAGWQHSLAGYVDPSWSGQITLELQNVRRFAHLPIYPGAELCQLRLTRLSRAPDRGYNQTGRYHGDMGVQANKDGTLD